LKRIPIGYREFLRDIVSLTPLTWDEQAYLERILAGDRAADLEQAARTLVDSLVERGALEVVEREVDHAQELLRLRDPRRRLSIRIRLPLKSRPPEVQKIRLPLDPTARTGFHYQQVRELLAVQGNLVSYNRVMTPRELTQQMEKTLSSLLPVASAAFFPTEVPAEEDWSTQSPGLPHPPPQEEIEDLARRRDHLLLYPDLGKDGSLLLIGMGDEGTGWRGILSLQHPQREHFTSERLSLALLVAQHFQSLLTTSIQLQGMIFYDFVTGVYNRSYFEEQLEREIAVADRHSQSMALLIIDIDDFKAFNTRYGYKAGDRVLATVACVLKAALRHTDTLARYGGEEFAAILSPPVPKEEARAIAERLRMMLEQEPLTLFTLEGVPAAEHVTVSVGGVLYPEGGRTVRDLWNGANRLLLEAKERGKNRVRFPGDPD
jgi:diguanylate cyclase (GGDEF)-like protein